MASVKGECKSSRNEENVSILKIVVSHSTGKTLFHDSVLEVISVSHLKSSKTRIMCLVQ